MMPAAQKATIKPEQQTHVKTLNFQASGQFLFSLANSSHFTLPKGSSPVGHLDPSWALE